MARPVRAVIGKGGSSVLYYDSAGSAMDDAYDLVDKGFPVIRKGKVTVVPYQGTDAKNQLKRLRE